MVTIYDVDPNRLIEKASIALSKDNNIKMPDWGSFVKTGKGKERPPIRTDWWHVRTAAVLRTVYSRGPIGVSKLRTKFGNKQNRGVKPYRFSKASGNILRKILQQLQTSGYVEYKKDGVAKGRIITGKGKKLLDNLAKEIKDGKKQASE